MEEKVIVETAQDVERPRSRKRVIYAQRVAGYLMQRGFTLIAMRKRKDNPNFNVFIFRNSDELDEALKSYSASKAE